MEQKKKELDVPLDRFCTTGVEVPQSHFVIHENLAFIGAMAQRVRQGDWTVNDVREFLESRGYRRETVNRFARAVSLHLKEDAGSPTPEKESRASKKAKPSSTTAPDDDEEATNHNEHR